MAKSTYLVVVLVALSLFVFLDPCLAQNADTVEEETLTLGLPQDKNGMVVDETAEDDGEWRTLGKDEAVPRGSHVRLDMTTGARTIKVEPLVQEEEKAIDVGSFADLEQAALSLEDREHIAVQEMEKILHELPEPEPMLGNLDKSKLTPEEYEAAIKKIWNARQAMIKEAMESMQNEAEDMKRLLSSIISDNATSSTIVHDLEVLEDLVDTIDNSQDFVTLGGLEVCDLILDHENGDVRTAAAYLVGITVRHLPHLQLKAIQLRIPQLLIDNLNSAFESLPLATSDNESRALTAEAAKDVYALSAILRGSNVVQQIALEKYDMMSKLEEVLGHAKVSVGIRSKVVRLASDLFQETYCGQVPDQEVDMVVIPKEEDSEKNNEAQDECAASPIREFTNWERWCSTIGASLERSALEVVEYIKAADDSTIFNTKQLVRYMEDAILLQTQIAPLCSSTIQQGSQAAVSALESVENALPVDVTEDVNTLLQQLRGL